MCLQCMAVVAPYLRPRTILLGRTDKVQLVQYLPAAHFRFQVPLAMLRHPMAPAPLLLPRQLPRSLPRLRLSAQATTAGSYTIQSCMDECNRYTACVAASTDGTSCNLFSSVTGSTSSPGTVAAYKVSGPPPSNVQTVTVCANRVTAYTTVWTTATHTTCPADSTCTAAPNYDNGFIGTQRARR
jgi:hypothetical protein